MSLSIQTSQAVQAIKSHIHQTPKVGLILGSGLGSLCTEIQSSVVIRYEDIPGFLVSTVEGHEGQLVIGELEGCPVVAMQGRFHLYEGYSPAEIVFPIVVMKELGIDTLLVSNAAGGMNPSYQPGDLMLITDHLNFTGVNPLCGAFGTEIGLRFPDLTGAYSPELRELAIEVSQRLGTTLHQGIYTSITGPNYLTSAELKMLRFLGGDAIGMSTVPEIITGAAAGLKCLAISCITDRATGDAAEPLSHDQVIEVANQIKPSFMKLIREILKEVSIVNENS